MRISAWIIMAAGVSAASGCGYGPRSVSDPDPAVKIPAIELAVQENDRGALPQLVADLDNADPAVRFYAVRALRKLTGQDLGYKYYFDDDGRKAAVDRWKKWLAEHPK